VAARAYFFFVAGAAFFVAGAAFFVAGIAPFMPFSWWLTAAPPDRSPPECGLYAASLASRHGRFAAGKVRRPVPRSPAISLTRPVEVSNTVTDAGWLVLLPSAATRGLPAA
jgi:hypothetical protein